MTTSIPTSLAAKYLLLLADTQKQLPHVRTPLARARRARTKDRLLKIGLHRLGLLPAQGPVQ